MNTDATIEHEESVQAEVSELSPLVGMMRPAVPFRQKPLFEHSLLETSGEQRSRRTWATLLSLVLQCSLVAVLILVPLWFTDVLPKQQLVTFLVAPSPPPPPPPPAAPAPAIARVVKPTSDIMNGQLRTPDRIPNVESSARRQNWQWCRNPKLRSRSGCGCRKVFPRACSSTGLNRSTRR
jgi:hypothetical protein